ncbi:hypothetical protein EVAR_68421_1 [Eumeta japonica]|uniref:Uncharacterized protein n=1 Tax=Eumeta variegata TaxID=151549 RepID=A0A4C1ZVM5_EUMVA|nr:hypothetical protein EVAR_68421_1 [Eumeta japonica]
MAGRRWWRRGKSTLQYTKIPAAIQNLTFAECKRFVKRKLYGKGYDTVLKYLNEKPWIELLAYQIGIIHAGGEVAQAVQEALWERSSAGFLVCVNNAGTRRPAYHMDRAWCPRRLNNFLFPDKRSKMTVKCYFKQWKTE